MGGDLRRHRLAAAGEGIGPPVKSGGWNGLLGEAGGAITRVAEDVQWPPIVERDDRDEYDRNDRHHDQRVVAGGHAVDGQLYAALVLETITLGYSAMKISPIAAAIANPEATTAQPSLSVLDSSAAKITAIVPKIWAGDHLGASGLLAKLIAGEPLPP